MGANALKLASFGRSFVRVWNSLAHSLARSFVRSVRSYVRSFIHSFIHSFIGEFVRSFIHLFNSELFRSFIRLTMAHLLVCSSVSLISFINVFGGSLPGFPILISRFYFLSVPGSPLCSVACSLSRLTASRRSLSLHSTQVPLDKIVCKASLQNMWCILMGYPDLHNLHPVFLYRNLKRWINK